MEIFVQRKINQYFKRILIENEEELKQEEQIQEQKNQIILRIIMQKMLNNYINQLASEQINQ